ncbi:MAG: glycosyl transferase, partial [Clostridia bacterium]
WAISALHQLGQDGRAWELALAALPVNHAATQQLAMRYRVEPYAMAADIYANPQQRGRGGWTWYTGSASWYCYVLLEQLFGFQKVGSALRFRPNAPADWDSIRLTYRYGTATYHLRASRDCPFPVADGEQLRDGRLILLDDGRIHEATFPLR